MFLLLLVSLVWAFSFGLIKGRLAGVDPTAVAALRLGLSFLVFLPFARRIGGGWRLRASLAGIGAVQFGLMYILYLRAFAHLQAYEVALFTITTPFFVALLDGAMHRRFVAWHAVAALLSAVGAGLVDWRHLATPHMIAGILLVQGSNVCFAAGQVAWRQARRRLPSDVNDSAAFAWVYAGAMVVSFGWSWFATDWTAVRLNLPQALTLLYLGVLASGVCFFWWNKGATRVNAGTLAVFNNAKIPLAVACSLAFFGERADPWRLAEGAVVMAAGVWLAEWSDSRRTAAVGPGADLPAESTRRAG